jgi:hypothetical protein
MSDENPFDEDELKEAGLLEEQENQLTPEEVFSIVMINKKRGVKTHVELRDEQNNTIQLHEIIDSLLEYMKGKFEEENNQFADQIFPMMGQALVSGLGRLIGNTTTAFFLANETTKNSLMWMMCLSFLLLKYVQERN